MNLKKQLQQHMHKQERDILEQNQDIKARIKASHYVYAKTDKLSNRQKVRIALSSLACVLVIVIAVAMAPTLLQNGNMDASPDGLGGNSSAPISEAMPAPSASSNQQREPGDFGGISDDSNGQPKSQTGANGEWFTYCRDVADWAHADDELPNSTTHNGWTVSYYYKCDNSNTVFYAKCVKGSDTIYIDFAQNGQYLVANILSRVSAIN